jgi:hypothetical protein
MTTALLLLSCWAGSDPWIESADFPRQQQEAALSSTLRLTNETGGEGTAVRIGRVGPFVVYLTACHNVAASKTVNLDVYSASSPAVPVRQINRAEVVERWPGVDLALLRGLEPDPPAFAKLAPVSASGESSIPVLTVGCSSGRKPSLQTDRLKRVIANKPDGTRGTYWQGEVIPVTGRSGGPSFDAKGYLNGICSGTDMKNGYYVHVDEIRNHLKKSPFGRAVLDGTVEQPVKK